jgi:hypothetical protein
MKTLKKLVLSVIGVVAAVLVIYLIYFLVHYTFYNEFKKDLVEYEDEAASESFTAKDDSSPVAELSGYSLASESDVLKLYVNENTAEVAIYDKRNGQITRSNPTEEEIQYDTVANGVNQNWLRSQLIVDFFDNNRKLNTFDSYSYSTNSELKQFEIMNIPNGVRVLYTIGDMSSPTGVVPIFISKERLEEYMGKMSDEEAKYVKGRFRESEIVDGFYELMEKLQTAKIEKSSQLRKTDEYLRSAGYTEEDYLKDMESSGQDFNAPISFTIPLDYVIAGEKMDAVEASVVAKDIVENGGGQLMEIRMLRYMGATKDLIGEKATHGYILVPNGSGSLIKFNNGKTNSTVGDYSAYVYGQDPTVAEYTVTENLEIVRLPLWGIYNSDTKYGVFATIENGESIAQIWASPSGRLNSYNYAYAAFAVRGFEYLKSQGSDDSAKSAAMTVIEPKIYDTEIKVRYTFLDGTQENGKYDGYSGMANYFRERLASEGILKKQTTNINSNLNIPFYYDIIGGVKKTDSFIGIQYREVMAMTTFDEAGTISDELKDAGVFNQVMNFQGWFNGGYYHDVPSKVKILSKLGGKNDIKTLKKTLSENGGKLYADVALQKVTYISKRYNENAETSKYYASAYTVTLGLNDPSTLRNTSSLGYRENIYNILSPRFLGRYTDSFLKKISANYMDGISLRDLGDTLSSDKKRKNFINRDEAEEVVKANLKKIDDSAYQVMISGGNFYSLFAADDIINAPDNQSDFYILDSQVPFYQMLIHGYANYTGEALNIGASFDFTDAKLKCIEYGEAPHFTFTYKDANLMKYTGLNRFSSTTFSTWKDTAAKLYSEVNECLNKVTGCEIVKHEILADGVTRTTYDNGVQIIVNTTTSQYVSGDIVVEARDVLVK